RSAELCKGSIKDQVFLNLKRDEIFPYRSGWKYMSNNSAVLWDDEDYNKLGEIAQRVIKNGEPGIINLRNFPYGRIGKKDKLRKDEADGVNPCGEQELYDKEGCDLADTLPTNCNSLEEWLQAC